MRRSVYMLYDTAARVSRVRKHVFRPEGGWEGSIQTLVTRLMFFLQVNKLLLLESCLQKFARERVSKYIY